MQYDNYIKHHGVKGMKWGIRKEFNEYRSKRNAKYKGSTKDTKSLKKFKATQLDDDQLREAINRLDLENRYSEQISRYKKNNRNPALKGLVGAGKITKNAASTSADLIKVYEGGRGIADRSKVIADTLKTKRRRR